MTYAKAHKELADLGVSLVRSMLDNEFKVNLKGASPESAYFTTDLDDAVATGKHMAARAKIFDSKKVEEATDRRHIDQLLSEYKERVKFAMSKAVCDIPQTEEKLLEMYDRYDPANKRLLVLILYKEIGQLIEAVRDCK